MKFSQFKCVCGVNDLEIIKSKVDESKVPAIGTIVFQCKECGIIFEEKIKAVVIWE